MSGPDRIWAGPWEARPSRGQWSSAQEIVGEGHEYIRRDPAVIAALPEVQAIVDAAVNAALDDVTTLHRVVADIREATVGVKPMLSDLAQALVQWRDDAVKAEREVIMPEHVIRVASMLIDCLHCLDTEAVQIADATNRSGGIDGVQVLEDAEKIIKAAAGLVAIELRGAAAISKRGEG